MKRGSPPTPTKILELRGSWRSKIRDGEAQPLVGRPDEPASLSLDAKAIWDAVLDVLQAMGLLTVADGAQLERYCIYFVRWRQCEKNIAAQGMMTPIRARDPKRYIHMPADGSDPIVGWEKHPQLRESRSLDKALKEIEMQFGLTPSARARLAGVAPATEADPMEKFFATSNN